MISGGWWLTGGWICSIEFQPPECQNSGRQWLTVATAGNTDQHYTVRTKFSYGKLY